MYSLSRIAFKIYKGNKGMVITAIVTITISVMLIINMLSLTKNATRIMTDELFQQYGNMNLSVSMADHRGIDNQLFQQIKRQPNINEVARVVVGNLEIANGYQIYALGLDNTELSKSRYKYTKDIGSDQVIINKGLADFLDVSISDIVLINNTRFQVVEILNNINESSSIPDFAMIHIDTYLTFIMEEMVATYLMIDIFDEVESVALADRITSFNDNVEVDIFIHNEEITRNLDMINAYVIILSFIAIMICGLLLISNFQTFLYQYRKQFSLIRAIGGSVKQSFKIIFLQSLMLSLTGVFFGLVFSYIFHNLLQNKLGEILINKQFEYSFVLVDALKIAFVVFIIIQLFMLIPVMKYSRILPLEIVRENEELDVKGNVSKILGYISLVFSMIFFLYGVYFAGLESTGFGILSAVVFMVGVYLVFPYYIKEILLFIMPGIRKVFGNASFVALKNVIPQVKKNSIIILSISLLVALSIFGGTILNTISKNNENYLKSQYKLDLMLTAREGYGMKINHAFYEDLMEITSIRNILPYSIMHSLFYKNDDKIKTLSYSLMNFDGMASVGIINENSNHRENNGIIVTVEFAEQNNLSIGDKIYVMPSYNFNRSIDTITVDDNFNSLIINGIYENIDYRQVVMVGIDWENDFYINEFTIIDKILIGTYDLNQTIADLENLRRKYPNIKWSTLEEALETSNDMLNQRWKLLTISITAILIGLIIGSQNMMINNILNKRIEYAILRTLKVNRGKLINIILTQVLTFNFIGVVLGGIIGIIISNILTICEGRYFSSIDFTVLWYVILMLVFSNLLIFIPFGSRLAKGSIATELKG
ncbi:putative ABC transport system permease protein [Natranaerovirga pectinivora]|uniref:Putative ABC transport system permease protein n=1 Tax=Natranaerovirga pectinivora TaxID=682400 RepID=A0A4R3MQT1_9FIRM|nr:ABC transporter permease [Natranaerovirga pectinivora]TCT17144.1 putative ABC transport system permease protein [Natranaerovirga pectinivora]